MIAKETKRILMMPIKISVAYLFLTIILFLFGPNEYSLYNKEITITYIISTVLLLYIGYIWGVNHKNVGCEIITTSKDTLIKYFYLVIVVELTLLIMMFYSRTGSLNIGFENYLNLGEAYKSRFERDTIVWIERFLVVFAPLTVSFIPYSATVWSKVDTSKKLLIVFAIALRLHIDLVQGINKGLADLVIFLALIYLLRISRSCLSNSNMMIYFNKKITRVMIFVIIMVTVVYMFFSISILSRAGYRSDEYSESAKIFSSYFTQGYQAVDYSFTQEFTSTYGLGHSMYLLDVSKTIFANKIFDRSYVAKNMYMYDYDYHMHWSTFYVWVANDISLIGVLPLMVIIGFGFAETWRDSIYLDDFPSVVLACLLFQLVLYLPANNQIFQLESDVFGSWFWIVISIIKSRKRAELYRMTLIKEKELAC